MTARAGILSLSPLLLMFVACGGGSDGAQPDASLPEASPADASSEAAADDDAAGGHPLDDAQAQGDARTAEADSALDDASDAGADADAGMPSVLGDIDASMPSTPGLVLWLEASAGTTLDGGLVTAWADQSGQGNDGVAGKLPPAASATSIHGLPAIHFIASMAQMFVIKDSPTLQWGTGPYLVEAVGRFDNDPTKGATLGMGPFYVKLGSSSAALLYANYQTIDDAGAYGAVVPGLWSFEAYNHYAGVQAAYNDSAPRLYAVQFDGTSLALRVNGVVVTSATGGVDVSGPGRSASVGGSLYGSGNLDGDIAEVVAVKGAISAGNLASLEAYLMAKYAL